MAAPSSGGEKVKFSQAMADGSKMQWEADRQEERSNHIKGERATEASPPHTPECAAPPRYHRNDVVTCQLAPELKRQSSLKHQALERLLSERFSSLLAYRLASEGTHLD